MEELEKAFGGPWPERRKGPPPRRPRGRVLAWLGRGKLWDDVFTRTLSGVLTIGIIAVLAALTGLIQFDRQAWAIVAGVGGIFVAVIVANVWPVRYLPKQWVRWVIFWLLIFASIGIAWRLYGPVDLPQPSGECDDPLVC